MATYVGLLMFTGQGMENIQDSPKRADQYKKIAKKMNIKVKDIYWTMGDYDGVIVFEAPDDETATSGMLSLGLEGNVTTKTLRAFTANEMKPIIDKAVG